MAMLSRTAPPRSAEMTRIPANSGPSTTVDHSSALKSAFVVMSFLAYPLRAENHLGSVRRPQPRPDLDHAPIPRLIDLFGDVRKQAPASPVPDE